MARTYTEIGEEPNPLLDLVVLTRPSGPRVGLKWAIQPGSRKQG